MRTRIGPVGRPFAKGNPGGGRKKGVPNRATLEIKEFGRNFLMSEEYRAHLERRMMAGKAPHMEVLLHHYAFGKPRDKAEIPPPQRGPSMAEGLRRLSNEDRYTYYTLLKKMQATPTPVDGQVVGQHASPAPAS